jgi:hypothetical protein
MQGRMQQSTEPAGLSLENDDNEYRRKIIAFAGRKMACTDYFDTCSGNPIRPHALESETLCTCRDTPSCRLGCNHFFQARRRYVVRVPA